MDLTTTYLGLKLKNPIAASASPLSADIDGIRRLEDAGVSAVVLHSLFEEQIEQESSILDHFLTFGAESYSEALSYLPEPSAFVSSCSAYISLIQKAKSACRIPIIASLNGVSAGGWMRYASQIEEAGADALELNLYYLPTDATRSGLDVEMMYLDAVQCVRNSVRIPISVKIGPYFSSLPSMARRFSESGADGLVLFNRFYQPDLDLENLDVTPNLTLSRSEDLRLGLRWVAILHGHINVDFALSGGVHSSQDVLKGIMAGANVTMMTSELLRNGVWRIEQILNEIESWMVEKEYISLKQMRGSMSRANVGDPDRYERANYIKVLQSFRNGPSGA